jgi:MFS family permease
MTASEAEFSVRSLLIPVFLPSLLFTTAESALLPVIPSVAQNLGASLPVAGAVTGALMIGQLLADIPAARLVNKLGERWSMVAASALGIVGLLLAFCATELWMLALGNLAIGAGAAVFGLARHGYMTATAPLSHRARALSLLGGTFRAGAALGPLIGAYLLANFSTDAVFAAATILCLLAIVVVLFSKNVIDDSIEQKSDLSTFALAKLERKSLLTIGLGSMILMALRTIRYIGLPLWALHIGLEVSLAALIIGMAAILDLAFFYTSGQIMDRWGRRAVAIPTLLGLGITFLLFGFATNGTGFFILALAMSLANAVGSGLVMVLAADNAPPQYRNQYLAVFRLLLDSGAAVAPQVLAIITAAVSLSAGLASFGALGLVGAWIMWRFVPKRVPDHLTEARQ